MMDVICVLSHSRLDRKSPFLRVILSRVEGSIGAVIPAKAGISFASHPEQREGSREVVF